LVPHYAEYTLCPSCGDRPVSPGPENALSRAGQKLLHPAGSLPQLTARGIGRGSCAAECRTRECRQRIIPPVPMPAWDGLPHTRRAGRPTQPISATRAPPKSAREMHRFGESGRWTRAAARRDWGEGQAGAPKARQPACLWMDSVRPGPSRAVKGHRLSGSDAGACPRFGERL
jgi:hypothetical protein